MFVKSLILIINFGQCFRYEKFRTPEKHFMDDHETFWEFLKWLSGKFILVVNQSLVWKKVNKLNVTLLILTGSEW